jgi:hypothetical protein
MSKRDIYEEIVAEVESDKEKIEVANPTTTYAEMVEAEGISLKLPEGVLLKSATSAFADYAIRDALLIKTMEDEDFAFVLVNKISNTITQRVANKTIVTQDDVEALATANQVLVMWEKFGGAVVMTALLDNLIEDNKNLREPALNTITKRLLQSNESFPFAETRRDTIASLSEKVLESLNNE